MSLEPLIVPVGTHAFRQRYLFAFATQAELQQHVRTQALESEANRLPEIMSTWEQLQPRLAALYQQEAGYAETMQVEPVPGEYEPQLQSFLSDPLFQRSFS